MKTRLLAIVAVVLAGPLAAQATPISFTFSIGGNSGSGSLDADDLGGGAFHATSGTLNVTGGLYLGSYTLVPGGPGVTGFGVWTFDNVIRPASNPQLDTSGLLFSNASRQINIFGGLSGGIINGCPGAAATGPNQYTFCTYDGQTFNWSDSREATFTSTVPEPATLGLLGLGLAGVGFARKRKAAAA